MAIKSFINSYWFDFFTKKLLPRGLMLSYLFENLIEKTMPSALFVGDVIHEGYALYKAKENNISTVLVQNKALCNGYSPAPADYFIVKNAFWKDKVAEKYKNVTFALDEKIVLFE